MAQIQLNSVTAAAMPSPGYEDCEPTGAPRPSIAKSCEPYMDPRCPSDVYGCKLPANAAARDLCWVETTLRSRAAVAAGGTIRFSVEVKWWFQVQEITNLGEEAFATFDLIGVKYGQSDYNLRLQSLQINGEPVTQSGVDVRKWNQSSFGSKFYPIPACGLDDPVELVFENVSAAAHDLEILIGGPAVLQIG